VDLSAALVQKAVLAPDALARALAGARNGDVASAALRLGLADEQALVRVVAEAYECPGVDLSRTVVPTANLAAIEPELCRERRVLPLTVGRTEIVLAMADPDDLGLADEIRFVTGRKVIRLAAVPYALDQALAALQRAGEQGQQTWRGPAAPLLPDPAAGWVAVVKPGERGASAVDLPEADEEMELVSASEVMAPFETAAPARPQPRPAPAGPLPPRQAAPAGPPAPARPQPRGAAPAPLAEEAAATVRLEGFGAGRVALVADDDPEVLKLVQTVIGKIGCVVLTAANGHQALETVREARPDLVLLDAMMPGLHGFEVCRAIKADPQLARIPVILCSAIYRGTVGEDAQVAFGADAFLEKPFRLDELTRVVRVALLGAAAETPEEKAEKAEAERCWRAAAQALGEGKEADGATWARQALARDPRSAEAHYYLGHALARQNQLFDAVAAYERAAELRPDVDATHQCLAQTYEKLGFQKSAREAWARAIETSKDPARRKTMQARLLALLGV